MTILELADAIEKADWTNASIGNKALLHGAIAALRASPSPHAEVREELGRMLAQKFPETFTPYGSGKTENAFAYNVVDAILAALSSASASRAPDATGEVRKAIKAIENWQRNRATTFTASNILQDFGDIILAALASPPTAPDDRYNSAFVAEIKRTDALPPEASFSNAEEMLQHLNTPVDASEVGGLRASMIEECAKAVHDLKIKHAYPV